MAALSPSLSPPASDPPSADDELLTLEDVSRLLKVSPQTVRRWRKGEGCGEMGAFPEPDAWAGTYPRWLSSSVDGWSGSSRRMHRVVVDFKLPMGATLEAVVRDFRRVVTGTVGARYRLRVLPRLDGSTQVEIVWPKSSNVDARLILVCLTLRDTMPSIFVKVLERALRSRPALMEQLARANLKALSHIAD